MYSQHALIKSCYLLFYRLLVGLVSFPIFYVVKNWLLEQKKIHNEERKKIITELRRKQEEEFKEMERQDLLRAKQSTS
jgi:hypothetical protein